MGFRFRKSVNLGHGFRVNLSKSGVGYSWGTKGVRFTKTATGKSRKTFNIPGTGLSYTTESKKTKVPSTKKQEPSPPMNHPPKNKKNDTKTILLWCATVFCFLTALVYFPSFASVTALAISILLLPIKVWQDILHRFLNPKIKIAVSIILFVVTLSLVPSTNLSESTLSANLPASSTISTPEEDPTPDNSFAVSSTPDVVSSMSSSGENTSSSAVIGTNNDTVNENNTDAVTETPTNTSNTTQKIESNNSEPNSENSSNTSDSVQHSNAENNGQNNDESSTQTASTVVSQNQSDATSRTYILNTNSKKFHNPSCSSVNNMSAANKEEYQGSRDDLINRGYEPCKRCKP